MEDCEGKEKMTTLEDRVGTILADFSITLAIILSEPGKSIEIDRFNRFLAENRRKIMTEMRDALRRII